MDIFLSLLLFMGVLGFSLFLLFGAMFPEIAQTVF